MPRSARRLLLPLPLLAVGVLGTSVPAVAAGGGGGNGGSGGKVTICHRTHSTTNPYRRISVSISAVNGSSSNDHSHHSGSPFDPAATYAPNAKNWGDVIPEVLNWTTAGQALYGGSRCGSMTAQQFYNGEIEAGQSPADVLADLQEQGADEDKTVDLSGLTYTGTNPPPVEVPPVEVPPVEVPPVEVPPVEVPPVEVPPVEVPPVEVPPVEVPPVEVPPVEVPPVEVPPVEVPPVEVPPVEVPPVEVPPVEVPPVEVPPVEVPPAEVPPVEVPPAEVPPAEIPPAEVPPAEVPPKALPPVTATPPKAAPSRTLQVLAFLDLDGDGARGSDEPGLPCLPVTLDGTALGRTGRKGSATAVVTAGPHSLRVSTPASLAVTSSSDTAARPLLVVPASASQGWWGLRGTSGFDLAAALGEARWTWAGVDGVLGTADDVSGTGSGRVGGLPAGAYRIGGTEAVLAPKETLSLGSGALTLPHTGADARDQLAAGLALVLAGLAVTAAGRRKRPAV